MYHIKLTKQISGMVLMAVMFLFLPWAVDSSVYSINKFRVSSQMASSFFFYHDILPSKDEYKVGEQLTFFSFNDTYKPVTYHWNDRLWCDLDNDEKGYHLVGAHQDELKITETPKFAATSTEGSVPWDYTGIHPNDTGICYMKHYVTADVGYGQEKDQLFIGKQFRIVE